MKATDISGVEDRVQKAARLIRQHIRLERAAVSFKEKERLAMSNQDFAEQSKLHRQYVVGMILTHAQMASFIEQNPRIAKRFAAFQAEYSAAESAPAVGSES